MTPVDKILSLAPLKEKANSWRKRGLRIGFTNGCFDILHAGHATLLHQAKGRCDRLVLGLNGDGSVRRLKGAGRPMNTVQDRARVLDAAGAVDILVTNAGGPPPGMWSDWTRDDFIRALDANMLTPIALMTALLPGIIDRGWCRVVNITSQSVKAPIPALGLSNAARTGLTGYVAGTARQVAQHGVTINNMLPGIHATDRADALDAGVARQQNISIYQAREQRKASLPTRRYGTAE